MAKRYFPNVSIRVSVLCLLDMIQVSEVQIPSNLSVALNLCFLGKLGSPTQGSFILIKTRHGPNTAIALLVGFLQIELKEYLYSKVALFGTTIPFCGNLLCGNIRGRRSGLYSRID